MTTAIEIRVTANGWIVLPANRHDGDFFSFEEAQTFERWESLVKYLEATLNKKAA